jgi:hypothetical protein
VERTEALVLHASLSQLDEVANDFDDIRRALDFLFGDSVHKIDITE